MLSETAARFVYSNEDPIGRSMPCGVEVLDNVSRDLEPLFEALAEHSRRSRAVR